MKLTYELGYKTLFPLQIQDEIVSQIVIDVIGD